LPAIHKCSGSPGTPARDRSEWLLGISRNGCSGSIGIAARDHPVRPHLNHQISDIITELGYELVGRRFGVFVRVVEGGCSQNSGVADAAVYAEHVHQGDRVVDVGACVAIFAALHPVLFCRELDGANYATDVVGGLLHARSVAAAAGAWPTCM